MTDTTTAAASYDSKAETEVASARDYVKRWIDELDLAEATEKDWRKQAEETVEVYRGNKRKNSRFNILHSNVETLAPALYNSTPSPDVRRRFSDRDPVAKTVADILERSLSFSVDSYDFDAVMKSVIRDGEIVGRGVPRVRYVPTFAPMTDKDGAPVIGPDGQPQQTVAYEEVQCEYVPWKYFRRGPSRSWQDLPWVAFADFLSKDQLKEIASPEIADQIPLNYSSDNDGNGKRAGSEQSSIFRRAMVWQIWDKEKRKVISICPDYPDAPIAEVEDPLELSNFFPIPRPYQPVGTTDSLTPIVPYDIYRDLVDELNVITARISKLVGQLRPRGLYGGPDENDVAKWATAGDGELVPATAAASMGEATMDKLIAWYPLDPTVNALKQLVSQRDLVKQTIYEVTGVADIIRGHTQASETATAQQIKAQWGSLRIQDRQGEVARVARDLFRLKAEIIASKFSMDTLMLMTGIKLMPQALKDQAEQVVKTAQQSGQPLPPIDPEHKAMFDRPSIEEVEELLRSDVVRAYRIDIESDSTIRGDLTRNQQNMTMFLQGTAQFAAAMGPIIEKQPEMAPAVMTLYASFSRTFKLGKAAEDALDQLGEDTKAPQQTKPDPKAEADNAKAAASIEQTKMEMERDKQKHAQEMEKLNREAARDQQKFELEQQRFDMKQREFALTQMAAPPMAAPVVQEQPMPGVNGMVPGDPEMTSQMPTYEAA